jgi:Sigma-70, region 4
VAALASLPERQRLALFLRYYADLDYTGIAEAHDAARLLDREVVWAGTSVNGLALESVRELPVPAGDADVPGLSLMYESPQDSPHPESTEAATLADGLTALVGVHGYEPPEGTALLAGSAALLRSNGLVVAAHASDEQTQSPPLVPSSPTPAKCPCALGWVRPLEARPAASDTRAATERP